MYQTSEEFNEKVKSTGRTSRAKLKIGDTEITSGIRKISHVSGSCGSDSFSIGSVFSAYADIELQKTGIETQGKTVEIYFGLLLDDGTVEYAKKGTFVAEKPEGDTQTITFHAQDNIARKCNGLYVSTLTFPTTIKAILDDIASQTGITYRLNGLDASGQITVKPEGYLHSDVLGYMAGCMGGFVYCDADGVVVLSSFDVSVKTEVTPNLCWTEPTIGENQYTVGGLTVVVSESTESEQTVTKTDEDGETYEDTEYITVEGIKFTYGTGGIAVSNPFMTQELFDAIKEKVVAISFRPGTVEFFGDARLDPTDAVEVTTLTGETFTIPCMNIVQEFDGGLTTTVSAPADASLDGGEVKGPIQKTIERLTTDMVVAKEMISKRITADEAILRFASIERAEILEANIGQLSGDYAEFKTVTTEEFSAQRAVIDEVSGDLAAYKTTISDELLVAKGWMAEGSIGNAQISDLDAAKIKSGILDTALVTVKGTNGNLQIVDNTISISDSNHVRVQVGKDASGDYTLAVWDAAGKLIWDALGATENTIQRPIIRDEVVADDAAIKGTKLDIESVVTAVNGASTKISGTVVQVGDKTLNVALSEQETTITEYGEQISDHEARITSNEENILLKVSTQDFSSYKTTVNAQINDAKSEVIGYTDAQIATVNKSLSTTNQEISVMKGQIALKVEQTDIDMAISGVEVGGRNLAILSLCGRYIGGAVHTGDWANVTQDKYSFTTTGNPSDLIGYKGCNLKGEILTVSGRTTLSSITPYYTFYNDSGNMVQPQTNKSVSVTNGYFEFRLNIPTGATIIHIGIGKYPYTENYTVSNVKIEKGNKATDWTPAPEDIDSSINAVDNKFASYSTTAQMNSAIALAKDEISLSVSETYATIDNMAGIETRVSNAESLISVHSNEIALTVKRNGVISAINQSAEEVKIQADKITLAGATIADEFTATNLHITGNSTFDGEVNASLLDVYQEFDYTYENETLPFAFVIQTSQGDYPRTQIGTFCVGSDQYGLIGSYLNLGANGYVALSGSESVGIHAEDSIDISSINDILLSALRTTIDGALTTKGTITATGEILTESTLRVSGEATFRSNVTVNGVLTAGQSGTGTSLKIGDDCYIGDVNIGGAVALRPANSTYPALLFTNINGAVISGWYMEDDYWMCVYNGKGIYTTAKIRGDAGFSTTLGYGLKCINTDKYIVRQADMANYSRLMCFGSSDYTASIYCNGTLKKNGSTTTYYNATSSSDRRLKDEVYADMSPYEDFFMRLSPVAFTYHDGLYNAEKRAPLIQWGFYAQDTIEAFNESGLDWTTHELVVVEDGELSTEELKYVNEDDMLKMNYQNMTALNTYMIQKNHNEIEQLKEQIEILTLRLNQLQASA